MNYFIPQQQLCFVRFKCMNINLSREDKEDATMPFTKQCQYFGSADSGRNFLKSTYEVTLTMLGKAKSHRNSVLAWLGEIRSKPRINPYIDVD